MNLICWKAEVNSNDSSRFLPLTSQSSSPTLIQIEIDFLFRDVQLLGLFIIVDCLMKL